MSTMNSSLQMIDNGTVGRYLITDLSNITTNPSILEFYNDVAFRGSLLPSFIYIIILILVGIPGNIMVVYVFFTNFRKQPRVQTPNPNNRKQVSYSARESRSKTTDIFIISLAVFDLISCFVAMPIELYLLRNFFTFDQAILCKVSRSVSMFCTTSTSLVLLGIAVSRFLGIRCKRRDMTVTTGIAKIIVAVAVVIALCASSILFVYFGIYKFPVSKNVFASTCMIQNEYLNTPFPPIFILTLTCFHLIFDVIFSVTYGLLCCQVVDHKRSISTIVRFENPNKHSRRQSRTTNSPRSVMSENEEDDDVFTFESPHITTQQSESSCSVQIPGSHNSQYKQKKPKKRKMLLSNQSTAIRSPTRQGSVHGNTYRASRTTFMLFIVTLVFMITFAPYCIVALLRHYYIGDRYASLTTVDKAFINLFLRSYFLSSSINPIIYSFLNQTFQRQCKIVLSNFRRRFLSENFS